MSREKVIEIALNEVGYLEKKSNKDLDNKTANAGYGNYTKYARDLDNIPNFYNGKKNGYDWCDMFVDWCFVQAYGAETAKAMLGQPDKSTGAGCGFSLSFYRKMNRFHTTPEKGDQIFFKSGTSITHTGIVYDVDKTKVYTIEGNTSSSSGVVENGGAVAKKSYKLSASFIAGYGRPNYNLISEEYEKEEPKKEQIIVDGKWGKETTIKAQKVFGTTVDGIVSDQYLIYKADNPGLYSTTFEWKVSPNNSGSELIKAIQKKVKTRVDGHIGPNTITCMQKWLGTTRDGVVSNPSDMVRAFQKWLNKQ